MSSLFKILDTYRPQKQSFSWLLSSSSSTRTFSMKLSLSLYYNHNHALYLNQKKIDDSFMLHFKILSLYKMIFMFLYLNMTLGKHTTPNIISLYLFLCSIIYHIIFLYANMKIEFLFWIITFVLVLGNFSENLCSRYLWTSKMTF